MIQHNYETSTIEQNAGSSLPISSTRAVFFQERLSTLNIQLCRAWRGRDSRQGLTRRTHPSRGHDAPRAPRQSLPRRVVLGWFSHNVIRWCCAIMTADILSRAASMRGLYYHFNNLTFKQ